MSLNCPGHNDMVRCFACGVELFDWDPEADPTVQHAIAAPNCFFLQQSKGQEFIARSLQKQVCDFFDYWLNARFC